MTDNPIERLLAKLPNHQKTAKGWSACCPAHDDRRASLSIWQGDDGRPGFKCFAGCKREKILDALGLKPADLFPSSHSAESHKSVAQRRDGTDNNGQQPRKEHVSPNDAVNELKRQHKNRGTLAGSWMYVDAAGQPVGIVMRWNLADGSKDIRPIALHNNKWIIGGMAEPRPLYQLPTLAGAPRVYIVEGEKAADAARSIRLTATTSAHGAESARKTDWTPLAGKEVVLLPDNDAAGRKYADEVAAILAKLTPVPVVKIVDLPGLPDKGDIFDWVQARAGTDLTELRREVDALADAAEVIEAIQPDTLLTFQPFPIAALPHPCRRFVRQAAMAIGCDSSYVALPMLSGLAGAIGNSRVIRLKPGWIEPSVVWAAIVGESGTTKSPALDAVVRPIHAWQRRAMIQHGEAMLEYDNAMSRHAVVKREWEKSGMKQGEPQPEQPKKPTCPRAVVSDTTIEKLAVLMQENPRGLLLERDELAGWFRSFDQYKGGRGGDCQNWLTMFGARTMIVDRKTGEQTTIYVPRAAVSITGSVQPEILRQTLGREHFQDGLAARLLLAYPPQRVNHWTDAQLLPATEQEWADLFAALMALEPELDDNGDSQPKVLPLSPSGKSAWVSFYDQHAAEQAELVGDLAAAWSKLRGYAARLALIVHLVRQAARDATLGSPDAIDAASVEAAVAMARWFGQEAKRVYAMMGESEDERDDRELVELIRRKGGRITARTLQAGKRRYRDPGEAETALDRLAKAGFGRWDIEPTVGRPRRDFVLHNGTGDNGGAELLEENNTCASVVGDCVSEIAPDDGAVETAPSSDGSETGPNDVNPSDLPGPFPDRPDPFPDSEF